MASDSTGDAQPVLLVCNAPFTRRQALDIFKGLLGAHKSIPAVIGMGTGYQFQSDEYKKAFPSMRLIEKESTDNAPKPPDPVESWAAPAEASPAAPC